MVGFFRVALAAASLWAVPAAATRVITVSLGGSATNASSLAFSSSGFVFTAGARSFSVFPSTLSSLSQLSATSMLVSRSLVGIGVAGGASAPQIDTNQAARREGLLITPSREMALAGLRLSFLDNDDTLQVYGVRGSQLVSLGYPGVIRSGLTGPNAGLSLLAGQAVGPAFQSGLNSGTQQLDLVTPTAMFSAFFFTTRERGDAAYLGTLGQGYRIDSLTFAVPEPASWAMLVMGFAFTGAALRRRRGEAACLRS
jgi:hypothetical protein